MISVRKNYTNPPQILTTDLCKAAVEDILRRKALLGHPNMTLLLNSDLLYKLEDTYKGKCAFCEKKISVAHSSLLVSHYRPYSHYYWLAYEWSNLFPTCEDCFTFRENVFPVAHDENRFLSPPEDVNLWNSNYGLKEIPLILNPEIDETDSFFFFDIDGKIKPNNQHIRAQTTINVFRLNQGYGVIGRKKKINYFIQLFHEKLKNFLLQFEDGKHEKTQAQNFFGDLITELILSAQPEAEYSLLGKDMIKNFDYYFIQTLENSLQKETLEAAFYSCLSLKANSAAKKIVMQTDDKPTEQFYSFEKIIINNIKCFDEITIKYVEENKKNVLLMVGSNGSGKSSILQLIALAFAGVHKPPADYAWEGVIKDELKKADFHIHTKQNDGEEISVMRFEIDNYDIIHCKSNKDFYDSVRRLTLVLAYGSGRNLGKSDGLRYKNFEGIASLFGENRFLKSLNDEHTQVIVSEQFELLKNLINRIIQKIYQRDEFHLESFSSRDFYFKTSTGGFTTLNSLSDGFQTIFSWFFDMLIRMEEANLDISVPEKVRAIVLIDEIDMHLNLQLQKTFIPAIEEVFPLVQFIITTQSPFTVQSMSTNNVFMLENVNGKVLINNFFESGKPWAWSLTAILNRLVGQSSEISGKLDKKITDYQLAKREDNKSRAEAIYAELMEALPLNSSLRDYVEGL